MKYIRDRIRSFLHLTDSPNKLASAFALGVFIAFTPTIGLHVITCLFFASVFRLSKLVVLTGAFINNPWTMVPLYGFCLWFGIKITGSNIPTPHITWNELTFSNAYVILKPYLWPFIAGSFVAGIAAAGIAYALIYWAIIQHRKTDLR